MNGFTVVSGSASLPLIAQATPRDFPTWNAHPLSSPFQRALYRTVHPDTHPDVGFCVLKASVPVLLTAATMHDGAVSCFGMPVEFSLAASLDEADAEAAIDTALRHLDGLIPGRSSGTAMIKGGDWFAGPPTAIDRACMNRQGRGEMQVHAVADLTMPEPDLQADVRRRFRPYINWGRRNLRLVQINAQSLDRSLFDLYPLFHARIAGKTARGWDYWQVIHHELAVGRGEMTLGYMSDGALVAANIVIDAGETAYYASGVYDRARFDKPLSHWPMFNAMLRAKERGMQRFDLGLLPARGSGASEKELSIGHFKRGFTSGSAAFPIWTIALGN